LNKKYKEEKKAKKFSSIKERLRAFEGINDSTKALEMHLVQDIVIS
jgi:hypothetical protein